MEHGAWNMEHGTWNIDVSARGKAVLNPRNKFRTKKNCEKLDYFFFLTGFFLPLD